MTGKGLQGRGAFRSVGHGPEWRRRPEPRKARFLRKQKCPHIIKENHDPLPSYFAAPFIHSL